MHGANLMRMPIKRKYDEMKLRELSSEIEDLEQQYRREQAKLVALTKRALRARMSQTDVARVTGLSRQTVNDIAKTIETSYDSTDLEEQARLRGELFQQMRAKQAERRALIRAGREAGLTMYALAKSAGISQGNVKRIVDGS